MPLNLNCGQKVVILTTCHAQGTRLFVKRIKFQVHRARQSERYPNAVQHISIREYTDVNIRHDDIVEVPFFLVREEQIRHPYSVSFRQS